jgi:hypothetical protein
VSRSKVQRSQLPPAPILRSDEHLGGNGPRLVVSGGIVHSIIGGAEQTHDRPRAAAAGQGRIMPRRRFCSMISARPAIAAGPAARESGPR